jgi:undecaprenyl diphosphate synthase
MWKFGDKYLTVYTFSTENFKRGANELKMLFDLFVFCFEQTTKNDGQKCTGKTIGKVDMFPNL